MRSSGVESMSAEAHHHAYRQADPAELGHRPVFARMPVVRCCRRRHRISSSTHLLSLWFPSIRRGRSPERFPAQFRAAQSTLSSVQATGADVNRTGPEFGDFEARECAGKKIRCVFARSNLPAADEHRRPVHLQPRYTIGHAGRWQARQQPACDDSLRGTFRASMRCIPRRSGLLAVNLNPTANAFAPAVRTVSADHSPAAVLDVPPGARDRRADPRRDPRLGASWTGAPSRNQHRPPASGPGRGWSRRNASCRRIAPSHPCRPSSTPRAPSGSECAPGHRAWHVICTGEHLGSMNSRCRNVKPSSESCISTTSSPRSSQYGVSRRIICLNDSAGLGHSL